MSNVWDCEYYTRCLNNTKCLRCDPTTQHLLKLPEDKKRQQYRAKAKQNTVTSLDDNSGSTLEEFVAANFNNVPTIKEYDARRQAGSGNIWFMPGDVTDPVVLSECKERFTVNTKGEKIMSIPKTMLEKIHEESKTYGTYPAFFFRYKGDELGRTYSVLDFDVACEMIHEIKVLRHERKVQDQQIQAWKQTASDLQQEVERLTKLLTKK